MEILGRRKKNNPVLIGEPGVGKSAIVEGLAQMIAKGDQSSLFFNKRVLSLDITGIVAGTKYRGQFEERIKGVIKELERNPNIIVSSMKSTRLLVQAAQKEAWTLPTS